MNEPPVPEAVHAPSAVAADERRLEVVEQPAAERLGDQEVGLVVHAAQDRPAIGERPAVDVAELLEDREAPRERLGERAPRGAGMAICLELGVTAREELVRRHPVKAADEVRAQVVRRPEGAVEVGRWGEGDAGHVGELGVGAEHDDRVALVVESPASRTAGQLGVLARGERRATRAAVLGEPLDDDAASGHVDPQSQGLGREHCAQDPLQEALLDCQLHRGHEAGVVSRDA